MAAHVNFRIGGKLEVHWRERAIGASCMNAGELAAHRIREVEGRVIHSEGVENARLEHLAEPLSGDGLDDLTAPVDIGSVFPFVARIKQERGHQRRLGRRDDAGLTFLLRQAIIGMTEEIVTKARGVNHQHARGHIALRGA